MELFKGMNSENTALLVIDVINSCSHESCEIPELGVTFRRIREMVSRRLVPFIERYRKEVGTPVVFTKTVPWKKEFLPENINNLYEADPEAEYYSKNESGFAEEFYAVHPEKGDTVIEKNGNDAFANKNFLGFVAERHISYFVTTGVFTDGCVMGTVIGGFSRGLNFVTLRDLVETTDVLERQELQKLLLDSNFPYLWSQVITSKDFLNGWKG
jgi:nicotinamidase-related amidase